MATSFAARYLQEFVEFQYPTLATEVALGLSLATTSILDHQTHLAPFSKDRLRWWLSQWKGRKTIEAHWSRMISADGAFTIAMPIDSVTHKCDFASRSTARGARSHIHGQVVFFFDDDGGNRWWWCGNC